MQVIIEKEFVEIVKARMHDTDCSLRELSRRTGINHSNLSFYLNGKNSPGADQMERILSALGLKPHLSVTEVSENLASTS